MTSQVLKARSHLTYIAIDVHLDITKTVVDPLLGTIPDPHWMLHMEWVLPSDWQTRTGPQKTTWVNAVKAEIQTTSAARILVLNDEEAGGTVLSIEGATF